MAASFGSSVVGLVVAQKFGDSGQALTTGFGGGDAAAFEPFVTADSEHNGGGAKEDVVAILIATSGSYARAAFPRRLLFRRLRTRPRHEAARAG